MWFIWIGVVYAGLAGTILLTALALAAPLVGLPEADFVTLMGTMFLEPGLEARILGGAIHFVMGCVLAGIYAWLWGRGIGRPDRRWGFVFGLAHGFLSIAVMPVMLEVHPRADAGMTVGLAAVLLLTHVAYGTVVGAVYRPIVVPLSVRMMEKMEPRD